MSDSTRLDEAWRDEGDQMISIYILAGCFSILGTVIFAGLVDE